MTDLYSSLALTEFPKHGTVHRSQLAWEEALRNLSHSN